VNAAAILIIAIVIAAAGVLMMRFRKRWLVKINVAFTNAVEQLRLDFSMLRGVEQIVHDV
jgi:cell division protein FtsL